MFTDRWIVWHEEGVAVIDGPERAKAERFVRDRGLQDARIRPFVPMGRQSAIETKTLAPTLPAARAAGN